MDNKPSILTKVVDYIKSSMGTLQTPKYVKRTPNEYRMESIKAGRKHDILQRDLIEFQRIEDPPEELQLTSIGRNPLIFALIKDPSKEVQLAAIKSNSFNIRLIDNPCEEAQFAAIQQDWELIEFIDNPTEAVQRAAALMDVRALNSLPDGPLKSQIVSDMGVIPYGQEPTAKKPAKMSYTQLTQNINNISEHIKNPVEKSQLQPTQHTNNAFEYTKDPVGLTADNLPLTFREREERGLERIEPFIKQDDLEIER